MRLYIDIYGRFEINIPDNWNCREEDCVNGNPVTFTFGDDSEDCLQISCIPKSKGAIPNILLERNFDENKYLESPLRFLRRNIYQDDMEMTVWEAKVEDYFILVTHTVAKTEIQSEITKSHMDQITQSLETLSMIAPTNWAHVATHARFSRFMVSLLASIDLANKAQEKGSSIELVILYANQIDAQLRLALILHEQLQNSTNDIDISLIFQGKDDKPIFEKEIYKRSSDAGIIDEYLFTKLNDLYTSRNKVVHRYIISDLKTNDIIKLVVEYMDIHEMLGKKITALEQEQFRKNIGIYGGENNPADGIDPSRMDGLLTELHEKHANTQIIKEMTIKIPIDPKNENAAE